MRFTRKQGKGQEERNNFRQIKAKEKTFLFLNCLSRILIKQHDNYMIKRLLKSSAILVVARA